MKINGREGEGCRHMTSFCNSSLFLCTDTGIAYLPCINDLFNPPSSPKKGREKGRLGQRPLPTNHTKGRRTKYPPMAALVATGRGRGEACVSP